jgi:hypothetical protein
MSYPELPPADRAPPDGGAEAARLVSPRPLFPRALMIGAIVAVLAIAAVLILLRFLVAERIPDLTADRLESARQRWENEGPPSYNLDIEIRGKQPGTVHVEVRDRTVTAEARDGRPTPERTWDYWTVPGLFDMLDRELELAEDPQHELQAGTGTMLRLRCEFDDHFGFPQRFHRHSTGDAPELYWRVTSFQPM